MKLAHTDLSAPIQLSETKPTCLVIENAKRFRSWVELLSGQCEGADDVFILSDLGQRANWAKDVLFVRDPLFLPSLENSISKHLSRLMELSARMEYEESTAVLMQQLVEYADVLCSQFSFEVEASGEIDLKVLIKLLQIGPVWDDDFFMRLSQQMKLAQSLLYKKLFIFIGLKAYLTQEELMIFYQECAQYQMPLLLIESRQSDLAVDEHLIVIDSDLCEMRFL